jgi:hypothetical protein
MAVLVGVVGNETILPDRDITRDRARWFARVTPCNGAGSERRHDALHHRIALTPRRIAHDTFDVAAELDNPRTVESTCLITR